MGIKWQTETYRIDLTQIEEVEPTLYTALPLNVGYLFYLLKNNFWLNFNDFATSEIEFSLANYSYLGNKIRLFFFLPRLSEENTLYPLIYLDIKKTKLIEALAKHNLDISVLSGITEKDNKLYRADVYLVVRLATDFDKQIFRLDIVLKYPKENGIDEMPF